MADLIAHWNVMYQYATNRSINESMKDLKAIRYGNCQDFVNAMLGIVGIPKETHSYLLQEIIEKIKKKGSAELIFKPNLDFQKKFKFKELNTHEELDDFLEACFEIEETFENDHKDEWMFLKAIDDLMWKKFLVFEKSGEKKKDPNSLVVRPTFGCPCRREHLSYKDEKRDFVSKNHVQEIISFDQLDI